MLYFSSGIGYSNWRDQVDWRVAAKYAVAAMVSKDEIPRPAKRTGRKVCSLEASDEMAAHPARGATPRLRIIWSILRAKEKGSSPSLREESVPRRVPGWIKRAR